MTTIESQLLNIIQNNFPLHERPFLEIANQLSISEEQCIALLKNLRKQGVFKSIRPFFAWEKLGFQTLLVGMSVQREYVDAVASQISQHEGVTHNYERDGTINVWFTLIYETDQEKQFFLSSLRTLKGVNDLKEFPSEKTYKLGLVLHV